MDIFKTKECARRARKFGLDDASLREAVTRASVGQIDALIGKYLVKQRTARSGQGRSGGYRTVIALKIGERAIFLHVFEKSGQANLTEVQLRDFRAAAKLIDRFTPEQITRLVEAGELIEI